VHNTQLQERRVMIKVIKNLSHNSAIIAAMGEILRVVSEGIGCISLKTVNKIYMWVRCLSFIKFVQKVPSW
jgi:hypothetical protein